jgi:hypothetical protein
MKVLFLVIAFLFISSTAWGGTWGNILSGAAEGLDEALEDANSPQARQARTERERLEAEREYLERQTELEQQRINTEQQLILQQQWQLFQQQQQQLSHAQLGQKKELRLQLQKQESLQKRQEFIQLYLITTESAKAESTVTYSNLSVDPPNTIDSPSNKYAFFATKLSNVYHKPNCSKLVASDGLIRFDTQQKACKAGCLPCNYCKP